MRTAIVVPGHGAVGRDGVYRISRRCLRLVAEAERIARELSPAAVVFSGWSPAGGRSEAEQMRDAWRGPDVELVTEATARFTAENAARTLPLLLDRGVGRAVVVCTPSHLTRARFFFGRLYAAHGVATRFRLAPVLPSPAAIAWELVALPACGRQLRAAYAELERTAP
ncbi:MAG TPA: YdcF family protein [Gaiellaceae bacterium]|nr:YdcF family protein [Gaiellaceae bacterium]